MDEHLNPLIAACLRVHFPIDVDHFAREEALREKARERRLMAHPDSRDPEHQGDDDEH